MINLKKDIKKIKATADPLSYSMFLYAEPKTGKSTFVYKLFKDKVLFLATEPRERGLIGANVARINNWSEYSSALRQLKRDKELQDQFKAISVDTVDNLYRFAVDYTLAHYNEQELGEAPFGADYAYLDKIWQDGLDKIHKAGFTPIFVGHSKQATVEIEATKEAVDLLGNDANKTRVNGVDMLEFKQAQPDLKPKAFAPINKLVDSILYMGNEIDSKGISQQVIYLRSTPKHLAGNTFPKIKPVIPLDANSYRKALEDAVNQFDKSNQTTEEYNKPIVETDFKAIMKEANELGKQMVDGGRKTKLLTIIDNHLGNGQKLMEATPNQTQQVQEIIEEIKELGGE